MATTPKPPSLPRLSILLAVVALFLAGPVRGQDQGGVADTSIKCGGCSPCGSATCYMSPPPPPPVEYYPPPPPPPPKKPPTPPKTGYCPPPPAPPYSPGFIYVGAPPGSLYPIDQTYSGSTQVSISSVFGLGLLGLLSLLFL